MPGTYEKLSDGATVPRIADPTAVTSGGLDAAVRALPPVTVGSRVVRTGDAAGVSPRRRECAVYARSTTIQARLESIDAGVAFCRDEVMPQLASMPGCLGLSLLVDRSLGQCITTSSWESVEAMRASESPVLGIRNRAGEILGGRPEVQEWEIALLHRKHAAASGAGARVTWLKADPSMTDRAIDVMRLAVVPRVDELAGFCSISVFVDRATGMACITATYDDMATLEASRGTAATLRTSVTEEVPGSEVQEVAEFELALAHLHVPETV